MCLFKWSLYFSRFIISSKIMFFVFSFILNLSSMRFPTIHAIFSSDFKIQVLCFSIKFVFSSIKKSLTFLLFFIQRGKNESPLFHLVRIKGNVILSPSKQAIWVSFGIVKLFSFFNFVMCIKIGVSKTESFSEM